MKSSYLKIFVVTAATTMSLSAAAEKITATQKTLRSAKQMHPLEKVTIGLEDQYQAAVDPTGRFLVFAQKADLIVHLKVQDLVSGNVADLLPPTVDSQDPVFSKSGKLAFTYFKNHARGEICYVDGLKSLGTLSENEIKCLVRPEADLGSQRSNPFWQTEDRVGYVERDISTQKTKIISDDLGSHNIKVWAEGTVWAPHMRSGGKYLVYSQLLADPETKSEKRQLVVRDLQTSKTHVVRVRLPGLSGFGEVAENEDFLYFSHFLNDTNQDNAVDGKDNSVVFRLRLDRILSGESELLLPEQLTSVDNSCSFPRDHKGLLFLTCAFEDSLDIYRVSDSGVVPADWDEGTLNNAIQSARTYSDRILLQNALAYRKGKWTGDESTLFSLHFLAGDNSAAMYYLRTLVSKNRSRADYFRGLEIYLRSEELKKQFPSGKENREFVAKMNALVGELRPLKDSLTKRLVGGLLKESASPELPLSEMTAMNCYLAWKLAKAEYARRGDFQKLIAAYRKILSAKLSDETSTFYAFEALSEIERKSKLATERLSWMATLEKTGNAKMEKLLQAEISVHKIVLGKDDKEKQIPYVALDKLMTEAKSDYFLRKAMNVKAVIDLNQYSEFKYLDSVSSNWMRDTDKSSTEYSFARDVMTTSSLDEGYGYWAQKKTLAANGFFYGSVTWTDDLESHAGYMRTLFELGKQDQVDKQYKYLLSHNIIGENFNYVQALESIMRENPVDSSTTTLDKAIETLNAMDGQNHSAVRYLLLGYCYLERLLRTANGSVINQDDFQNAHRNLLLAVDQGRDTERVKTAALMNLGILHQRAGNFGMSAKFFAQREQYGFESADIKTHWAYLYARSLFHTFDAAKAAEVLSNLKAVPGNTAIQERIAFYNAMAGNFSDAAREYAELLKQSSRFSDLNLCKLNLVYGYALLKMQKNTEAVAILRRAADGAKSLHEIPKGGSRLVEFSPIRLRYIALGLLSRALPVSEQLPQLKEMQDIIAGNAKLFTDPEIAEIRLHVQSADSALANKSTKLAVQELRDARQRAFKMAGENGYLSPAIYSAIQSSLVAGILFPKDFKEDATELLAEAKDYSDHLASESSTLLQAQNVDVQLLAAGFGKLSGVKSGVRLDAILSSAAAQSVKSELPGEWKKLSYLERRLESN